MAETDAENRFNFGKSFLDDELVNVVDRLGAHLRISGTVTKEQSVVFILIQIVIPRYDVDSTTPLDKATNLVVL